MCLGVRESLQVTEKSWVFLLCGIRGRTTRRYLRTDTKEVSHSPLADVYTRPIWRSSGWKYCPDEEGIETERVFQGVYHHENNVGSTALMKKGLKHICLSRRTRGKTNSWKYCPDEEGIETFKAKIGNMELWYTLEVLP